MEIEQLSINNLTYLTELALELWAECSFEEEYETFKSILSSENEICFLVKDLGVYLGFTHFSIRTEYVEGATESPVAYIEALYIKPAYQRLGIGKKLVNAGENWSRQKGCRQLASDTGLNNPISIDFHRHTGFTEVNRIVCFLKKI